MIKLRWFSQLVNVCRDEKFTFQPNTHLLTLFSWLIFRTSWMLYIKRSDITLQSFISENGSFIGIFKNISATQLDIGDSEKFMLRGKMCWKGYCFSIKTRESNERIAIQIYNIGYTNKELRMRRGLEESRRESCTWKSEEKVITRWSHERVRRPFQIYWSERTKLNDGESVTRGWRGTRSQ